MVACLSFSLASIIVRMYFLKKKVTSLKSDKPEEKKEEDKMHFVIWDLGRRAIDRWVQLSFREESQN